MAEWLRRWTRNPMGSPRAGSNPAHCDFVFISMFFLFMRIFSLQSVLLLQMMYFPYGAPLMLTAVLFLSRCFFYS